jgi:tRNA (guanine26-N2/guanine27-N2)-dimethyltransferase
MLSLTVDFYVRLFIRVKEGAKQCHESITKYSHVYQCWDCEAHYLHPMGIHCVEEITFDTETGRKKSRKKHSVAAANKTEDEEALDNGGEEELKEGEATKIRDKYTLPQIKVPHKCTVCDGPLVMGGPIWNREIHNVDFVKRLLESARTNQAGENGHKLQTTERI